MNENVRFFTIAEYNIVIILLNIDWGINILTCYLFTLLQGMFDALYPPDLQIVSKSELFEIQTIFL